MKKVEAIIRPFKLDEVREALTRVGVSGMTVSEAKGFGRQKGHSEFYRGAEYGVGFLPKSQLTVVVPEEMLDAVVDSTAEAAPTARMGDAKNFVSTVEEAGRIRPGERDGSAL